MALRVTLSVPRVRASTSLVFQQVRLNSNRAPSGPNPHDAPTLEAVKQQWKKARFAKDADTATVLGVRNLTDRRGSSPTCNMRRRPRRRRTRSRLR